MQERHTITHFVCGISAVMLVRYRATCVDPLLAGVFVLAALANGAAGITGFGVGTILIPILMLHIDVPTALAVITVPHAVASAIRLWRMRFDVEPKLALPFCVAGGAGALVGTSTHALGWSITSVAFAATFVLAIAPGLFSPRSSSAIASSRGAWLGGVASGLVGAIAGSQGALRFAVLERVGAPTWSYVATASAAAVAIDLVRLPAMLLLSDVNLGNQIPLIAAATSGVLVGDVLSERLTGRIPRRWLARVESIVAVGLSALFLFRLTRS